MADGVLDADEWFIESLYEQLASTSDRRCAHWVMSRRTFKRIRQAAPLNGPFWSWGGCAPIGAAQTLLGYPIEFREDAPGAVLDAAVTDA
jgi:hypothetical protein